MCDWDDDGFEVDMDPLDQGKEDVENNGDVTSTSPAKSEDQAKSGSGSLSEAEKIGLQKLSDFKLSRDLFGISEDEGENEDSKFELDYSNISTIGEFRSFGEKIGKYLSVRSSAENYPEMVVQLMLVLVKNLDARKVRHIRDVLKDIADERKAIEKDKKNKSGKAGASAAQKPSDRGDLYDDLMEDVYDDFIEDDYALRM